MKKQSVAYRFISYGFIWPIVFASIAYAVEEPSVLKAPEPAVISNSWIHAEIDMAYGGGLNQFAAHQENFLHTQSKGDQFPAPGAVLVLYQEHPLASTATIELPKQFIAETTKGASDVLWRITPEKASPISVEREYFMSDQESAICVTTTITNKSESLMTFFPTERVKFNASFGSERLPNTFAYFYSPFSQDQSGKGGFDIIRGATDKGEFSRMPNVPIFITRYMMKTGEVKMTNEKGWFAFQNLLGCSQITGGTVCAVEYGFPNGKPELVKDNLILFVSGASDPKENQISLNPYLEVSYLLGKVALKPGGSFTYTARWTAVCCRGPIIDVRQGVVYNKHLETLVVPEQGAFVNFANYGIPQEGALGFRFYNKKGDVRMLVDSEGKKTPHLLVGSIATKERPKEIDPLLPTDVSLLIGSFFSPDDLRDENDSYDKLIEDQIQTVKIFLVDNAKNRAILRELDEFSAPFKVYDKPID